MLNAAAKLLVAADDDSCTVLNIFCFMASIAGLNDEIISIRRDFLKMDKKALAKFINFFLEDICQNHIKVICSYAQQ